MNKKTKPVLILLFIIILFIIGEWTGLRSQINSDHIKQTFENNLILGSFTFILIFAVGNLLYIPGWIFLMGAVLAVGKLIGGPLAFIGGITSSLLSYLLIGLISRDVLRSLDKYPLAQRYFNQLDEKPIRTIMILRLIFQTAPFLNYALILSRVRLKDYLLGTILGLPLPIIFYCLLFEFIFSTQTK